MTVEPKRFYLDTSAYLCVLLNEEGAADLAVELAGHEVLSSVLLILETNRTLVRLARLGHIKSADLTTCRERLLHDLDFFLLRDLTLDLCVGLEMPTVSTPRSLDLGHLRTALWFQQTRPITRFVSLDDDQNQAARELGLPT